MTTNGDEIRPHLFLNHSPETILLFLIPDTCVSLEEEEALLSEMDVTGQAFEDMQEQNSRLLQQLREKDDANFKLMSERIKSNQIYKLLKEEKEELADQVLTFKTQVTCNFLCLEMQRWWFSLRQCTEVLTVAVALQVDAQLLVVQKLEEKEGVLQSTLAALEKELAVRTQALELNKRKVRREVPSIILSALALKIC